LVGDFVRDKDAVIACALIAETAAWAADKGIGLYDLLMDIYLQFGLFKEKLISVVRKGKAGAEEIQEIMNGYRAKPPVSLNNSKVVVVKDYLSGISKNIETGVEEVINLPSSNVLQFFTADGGKVTVRPSGTEPKIKFYFGVVAPLANKADFEKVDAELDAKIKSYVTDLGLG